MIIWIDAQLSPGIAVWINETSSVLAIPVRDLGYETPKMRRFF
jgi:predicted nuclease of predicted toxin-antitoxin system